MVRLHHCTLHCASLSHQDLGMRKPEHATRVQQFFDAHPLPSAARTIYQTTERIKNVHNRIARVSPHIQAFVDMHIPRDAASTAL